MSSKEQRKMQDMIDRMNGSHIDNFRHSGVDLNTPSHWACQNTECKAYKIVQIGDVDYPKRLNCLNCNAGDMILLTAKESKLFSIGMKYEFNLNNL